MTIQNQIELCEKQKELRKMFPNLPNYHEMGFKENVSNFLKDNFGMVAWHFYQKQFEIQLLKEVMKQVENPCIFDLGGGLPISLERDYILLDKRFRKINKEIYLKNFNLNLISFGNIKSILQSFKNVIYLRLPQDYKKIMERAGKDQLNQLLKIN